jgi:hypothetical protein
MSPVFIELTLLLLPMQSDLVRQNEAWEARALAAPKVFQQAQASLAADKKRNFEERFNRLTAAVAAFSQEYNKTHGLTWPQDKAEALKKAIRDLEKAEPRLGK